MSVVEQITKGLKVAVEAIFKESESHPDASDFAFTFQLKIENLSHFPVRVTKQDWLVYDADGNVEPMDTKNAAGWQPLLPPEATYDYLSYLSLKTPIGKLRGTLTISDLNSGESFDIEVPTCLAIAPFKMN